MIYGSTPDQVRADAEGMRNLRMLAKNMAWLLRCLEAGKAQGVLYPKYE